MSSLKFERLQTYCHQANSHLPSHNWKDKAMSLPFTPEYESNAFDGTDVRNGNGELRGFTAKVGNKYVARLSNGLEATDKIGEYATNDKALNAIILAYLDD